MQPRTKLNKGLNTETYKEAGIMRCILTDEFGEVIFEDDVTTDQAREILRAMDANPDEYLGEEE
jgi:hypothetical protein